MPAGSGGRIKLCFIRPRCLRQAPAGLCHVEGPGRWREACREIAWPSCLPAHIQTFVGNWQVEDDTFAACMRLWSFHLSNRSEIRTEEVSHPSKTPNRAAIHEWLTTIYHKLAEPLPEGVPSLSIGNAEVQEGLANLKRRGRRPRHVVKKQDGQGHHKDVKFLPPGTIGSYFELCLADLGETCKVTRKVFCRAPRLR